MSTRWFRSYPARSSSPTTTARRGTSSVATQPSSRLAPGASGTSPRTSARSRSAATPCREWSRSDCAPGAGAPAGRSHWLPRIPRAPVLAAAASASPRVKAPAAGARRNKIAGARPALQQLAVLDDFPERILVDDLIVRPEGVDIAALVVERLAIAALAAHGPHRDSPVPGEDVLLVFPAHIGDLDKTVGEGLADYFFALERAADRLRPTRQAEHATLGEERDDAVDVAAVERRRDRFHQLESDHALLLIAWRRAATAHPWRRCR